MKAISLILVLLCAHAALSSFLFVGTYSNTISVYSVSEVYGAWPELATYSFVKNVTCSYVSWLNWLPSQSTTTKYIYGVNEYSNQITSFTFTLNGNLSVLNQVASGGQGPVAIKVHSTGKFVFVAHYDSGHVTIFDVLTTGAIGPRVAKINAGVNAHHVVLDRNFVFVPCLGSNYIAQYVFNPTTKTLLPNPAGATVTFSGNPGPRHMVFHPTLPYAYVINEIASTVSLMSYDSTAGTLAFVQKYSTLLPGFQGSNTGAEVVVHGNGKFLYASNRGNESIAIFSINQNNGKLTLFAQEQGQGLINTPRSFTLSTSNSLMVVANQGGGSVMLYNVSSSTGRFGLNTTIFGFNQPAFVSIYNTPYILPPKPTPKATPIPTPKPTPTALP